MKIFLFLALLMISSSASSSECAADDAQYSYYCDNLSSAIRVKLITLKNLKKNYVKNMDDGILVLENSLLIDQASLQALKDVKSCNTESKIAAENELENYLATSRRK